MQIYYIDKYKNIVDIIVNLKLKKRICIITTIIYFVIEKKCKKYFNIIVAELYYLLYCKIFILNYFF